MGWCKQSMWAMTKTVVQVSLALPTIIDIAAWVQYKLVSNVYIQGFIPTLIFIIFTFSFPAKAGLLYDSTFS